VLAACVEVVRYRPSGIAEVLCGSPVAVENIAADLVPELSFAFLTVLVCDSGNDRMHQGWRMPSAFALVGVWRVAGYSSFSGDPIRARFAIRAFHQIPLR
jgi:hypothetical protein